MPYGDSILPSPSPVGIGSSAYPSGKGKEADTRASS
jgi:hypothetical protein